MFIYESVLLAVEGLRANKMRALLTMLGIIIGIGSVIGIVTVGDSLSASITSNMQGLGATNLIVAVRQKEQEVSNMAGSSTISEADLITDEMIEAYVAQYDESIDAVSMSVSGGSGKAQDGRLYANVSISGVNDGYYIANNVELLGGRFIREGDVKAKRNVAVVSDRLVGNMFSGGVDPLGQEIKVSANGGFQTYTIIGVYKYVESTFAMLGASSSSEKDVRTAMYIPITTAQVLTSADKGYSSLTVTAVPDIDSMQFARETRLFFNNIYFKNNPRYEVNAVSMETMMDVATTMMSTLSIAVAVIAGISLVVGGIGVMNIMLVSVTERTREIGTRKALGARSSAVRSQFIIEAVIICGIGGVIGVLLGFALGYFGSWLMGFPGAPSAGIVIIAVVFSMLIGVFFGYYPANKAASLDPIEALRYE